MTTTKTAAELKTYRDQYVATRASALAEARPRLPAPRPAA